MIIAANGLEFTADVAGPAEGELVLLLHGFPQTRHTWRAELGALAAAGFRACAPDQRGYSRGARPEGVDAYRTQNLLADALSIADALGAPRVHLVGHDWGGQLAWLLAARHPERVRTLAVISRPHPAAFARALRDDPGQADRSRHHRAHQRAEATDAWLADDAARLRGALLGQGVPEADVKTYLATLGERAALDAAIHWYRAAGASGIALADVPPVSVPTLYVWGDADATVGRVAAEATRAFVTAPYRFVEVPGVGHFVTDQAPDVFPPLLLDALRRARREAVVLEHMQSENVQQWDRTMKTFSHARYELPDGRVIDGRDAVMRYWIEGRAIIPDQRNELIELTHLAGERVQIEFWLRGTPRPTGKPFEVRLWAIFDFDADDRMTNERVFASAPTP